MIKTKNRFRNLKWTWQRARRGYSDLDAWNLDWHLADLLVGALTQLKDKGIGFPPTLDTREEWEAILDEMIKGFEAYDKLDNLSVVQEEEADRLNGQFDRAKQLLVQWWEALWD